MEQYIGNEKIFTVHEVEEKTPSGESMVKVSFENGKSEIMPKKRLELINSLEVSDATKVQETINKTVSSMLFAVLHEYGIKMGEVNGVIDSTVKLVNSGLSKASDILWGFEYPDLPLNKVNEILLKNGNTKEE